MYGFQQPFSLDTTTTTTANNNNPSLENKTRKIHWDIEIQTDHQIPARRPDLVIINKKNKQTNK